MKNMVIALIEKAFVEINNSQPTPTPVEALGSIQFYGDNGVFDSMQLVNFLLVLEEFIEDELEERVSLTSERATSRKVSPFRSASDLAAFILEELEATSATPAEMVG